MDKLHEFFYTILDIKKAKYKMAKNIYIAASFAYADRNKTEERKASIKKIVEQIKTHLQANFYLPQELKIENAWDYSLEEWGHKVYQEDLGHLIFADTVIFISFGKENNAGAVWEVGFIAGLNAASQHSNKNIIMIKMNNEAESLMITNSVNTIITKEEIDKYNWESMPFIKSAVNQLS